MIIFNNSASKGALSGLAWFLAIESLLKIMKNAFYFPLFHFISTFCSQDIYIFVLTFWSCKKQLD